MHKVDEIVKTANVKPTVLVLDNATATSVIKVLSWYATMNDAHANGRAVAHRLSI